MFCPVQFVSVIIEWSPWWLYSEALSSVIIVELVTLSCLASYAIVLEDNWLKVSEHVSCTHSSTSDSSYPTEMEIILPPAAINDNNRNILIV